MFRFLILQMLLVTSVVFIRAQHQADYTKIDRWESKLELTDTSIVSFSQELTSVASTDFEKIRAIFQFVIRHVSYEDHVPELGNKRTNRSIYDILRRKKGICWDYSLLIAEMAKIAGLECGIVSGWGRDISENTEISIEPNHAWNIVLLDSNYYLLDATWSANEEKGLDAFQRKYETGYFLTPPHLFIVNHFPAMPILQLLDPVISFTTWLEQGQPPESNGGLSPEQRDRISEFYSRGKLEQRSLEAEAAHRMRPGIENQEAYGHALFDQAIALKDSADLQMELQNTDRAIVLYQHAINFFEKANQISSIYPWQKEAQAFCHLNYAQALYRSEYRKGRGKMTDVANEIRWAKALLQQLDTTNFVIKSALHQIEKQLNAIE